MCLIHRKENRNNIRLEYSGKDDINTIISISFFLSRRTLWNGKLLKILMDMKQIKMER